MGNIEFARVSFLTLYPCKEMWRRQHLGSTIFLTARSGLVVPVPDSRHSWSITDPNAPLPRLATFLHVSLDR